MVVRSAAHENEVRLSSPMDSSFDLIVVGAGSGGLAAAKRAAAHGARVAIVEGDRVGGTCVIRGCVPKKLLVYGAQARHQLEDAPAYGLGREVVKWGGWDNGWGPGAAGGEAKGQGLGRWHWGL